MKNSPEPFSFFLLFFVQREKGFLSFFHLLFLFFPSFFPSFFQRYTQVKLMVLLVGHEGMMWQALSRGFPGSPITCSFLICL